MSHLRQKLGSGIMTQASKAARSNELTNNWLRRLAATSTTAQAKDAHSQLSAVLDFFNSKPKARSHDIDWDGYASRIHTPGVVNKIQQRYSNFMATEYNV
jgi:hypothetical protein